jgi:hypothetical protein
MRSPQRKMRATPHDTEVRHAIHVVHRTITTKATLIFKYTHSYDTTSCVDSLKGSG